MPTGGALRANRHQAINTAGIATMDKPSSDGPSAGRPGLNEGPNGPVAARPTRVVLRPFQADPKGVYFSGRLIDGH